MTKKSAPEPARGVPLHTRMLIGLVLGAALGLLAHALVERTTGTVIAVERHEGTRRTVRLDVYPDVDAGVEKGDVAVVDEVKLEVSARTPHGIAVVVSRSTLERLKAGDTVQVEAGPRRDAVAWIVENIATPIGQVFLRLIFMVVVPLVVSSLILGVLELGDVRTLGRVGLRTLGYTLVASSLSVFVGVVLVNLVRPGEWVADDVRSRLVADYADRAVKSIEQAAATKPWYEALIPQNPVAAAADALKGDMLALMVFALVFGVALARVRDAETEPLVGALRGIQRACMVIIGWAMALAPFGVAGLLFSVTARTGFGVFASLGAYVGVVLFGLALQCFGVYSVVLAVFARVSPRAWFGRCREVMVTALSTSSSNATLPTSLITAREKLGVPEKIGNFVLTVGATGNQNGTALFEGITVLFLAQVFGVELTLPQQLTVVVMSILAGVGTAGVPGGSIPLIVIVLKSVGVPEAGIALVLGVDRILDMCRTVVNVVGDLVCATYVARAEGALAFDEVPATSS